MYWNIAPCTHPARNPAIQRCCDARNRAIEAVTASEHAQHRAQYSGSEMSESYFENFCAEKVFHAASTAYSAALPQLDSRQQVKDYTACVAHGMALEAIDPSYGPKLLYAAQVILTAHRQESKAQQQEGTAA
jgi:hypothetical protein